MAAANPSAIAAAVSATVGSASFCMEGRLDPDDRLGGSASFGMMSARTVGRGLSPPPKGFTEGPPLEVSSAWLSRYSSILPRAADTARARSAMVVPVPQPVADEAIVAAVEYGDAPGVEACVALEGVAPK